MIERFNLQDMARLRGVKVGERLPAMCGRVTVRAFKRGRYLWTKEVDNLVVTAHGVPTANLLAGVTANQSVSAAGYGTGVAAPALGDTTLSNPAYYNALTGHSFPTPGQVQFNFALVGGVDAGAYGMNIQEIGLFCNTGAVGLPLAGAPPAMTLFAHALVGLGVYGSSLTFDLSWVITT